MFLTFSAPILLNSGTASSLLNSGTASSRTAHANWQVTVATPRMNPETPEKDDTPRGDQRSDANRSSRVREVAVEMLGVSIATVVAFGLSTWIGVQLDSVAVGSVTFFVVIFVAFVVLSRRLNRSSIELSDVDPELARRASQATPPMHNLVKVPVFAGVLLALWVATCQLSYGIGLIVFLGFVQMVSKIVAAQGLPVKYGLLVIVLFWCSAVVLLMWPTGGYPSEIWWGTMVAGPVIHVVAQVIAYSMCGDQAGDPDL